LPGHPGYAAGHVGGTNEHTRGVEDVSHVAPPAQAAHATPPEPHALFKKPPSQSPCPSQHPGQLVFVQGGGGVWHVCPMHLVPLLVQSKHDWPAEPQKLSAVPVTQAFPMQQPVQFPGPHVPIT
jgi:hypothetical protein